MRLITILAGASAMALLAAGATAQDTTGSVNPAQEVLSGEAAYGNWQDDAPGVTREFSVADLPQPSPESAASNAPENIARPDGAMPVVPEGFSVELVAEDLGQPRTLTFAPNGDLFVANSDAGEVMVLRMNEGGTAEESVFAEGLNQPYGIAFYPADNPEWVYIGESDGLKRFPYAEGDLVASAGAETLVEGIPADGHWTRDVVVAPDGDRLFYAVGSESNVGDDMSRQPEGSVEQWASAEPLGASWGPEERRATVLSFAPDGTGEEYFATGLRNCSGMTIQPATGDLWCVVNERDGLGDNLPFDYATSVAEGGFYGWPWYYIGEHADPRWSETPREDLSDDVTVPDVLFQPHSAPLNIAFYDADQFGPEYEGDAFVAMHGSWNRGQRTGYKVVQLDFDENGEATGAYTDFMTGFVVDAQSVWGRPVGVAVGPDGALYVSEDGSGTIWKVTKDS